jgi:hypothetical protein
MSHSERQRVMMADRLSFSSSFHNCLARELVIPNEYSSPNGKMIFFKLRDTPSSLPSTAD